jgi:hypothetical protein
MTLAPSGIMAMASSTETTFMIWFSTRLEAGNIRSSTRKQRVDLHQCDKAQALLLMQISAALPGSGLILLSISA